MPAASASRAPPPALAELAAAPALALRGLPVAVRCAWVVALLSLGLLALYRLGFWLLFRRTAPAASR